MGNSITTIQKLSFENIQKIIISKQHFSSTSATLATSASYIYSNYHNSNNHLILFINTLPFNEQDCIITGTFPAFQEEQEINRILESAQRNEYKIVIYGKNSNDETLIKKYTQLYKLGFLQNQIYVYMGGMFEWLLLQDIYGEKEFPTTKKELDILKFRPSLISL